ncbi:MAG TPA: thioredoxin family protein [Polyangiaceae bacterium]
MSPKTGRRALLTMLASAGVAAVAYRFGPKLYNARRLRGLQARHPYDERVDGRATVAEALRTAARDGKSVLVILGGNWCQWCLALDELLDTDDEIRAFVASHYVVVHLDSEAGAEQDAAWGRPTKNGVPVLVVLDGQGGIAHLTECLPLELWGGRVLAYDRDLVLQALRRGAR